MRIAIFSNVNMDMLAKQLARRHEVYEAEGYNQWVQYSLAPNERLAEFGPKAIFLLLDGGALVAGCEGEAQGLTEIESALATAAAMADSYPRSTVVISTVDIPARVEVAAADFGCETGWEAAWAKGLRELAGSRNNVVPFDLKGLLSDFGRAAAYSPKMWYTGSIPYSLKGMAAIEGALDAMIAQMEATRKKVLVVDLDNTLWGGVVGEDGAFGIVLGESGLGAAYRDAQKRIKALGETGVLLAVASKNNPEDVDSAFERNPHMVLRRDDFVSIKANWEPKAQNVAAIAEELNLGIDSFVFLDDNPVEREQMAAMLPDTTVADFPADVSRLPETIDKIYRDYFWIARRTDEDRAKTQQYHDEAKRVSVRQAAGSMEEYLRSLEIDVEICEARDEQMPRVVQLLNKTNQFNTNTVRMDAQEVADWLAGQGNHVFVADVSDRYGDSGLVVIMLVRVEGDVATIENFLMSCRVMGRQIEDAFLAAVCGRLQDAGVRKLRASFVRTAKNKPVESLYDRLGFGLVLDSGDKKAYEADLPVQVNSVVEARWS